MLLFGSYYEFYVAALHAAVQLAVALSLLVSLDRVLNIAKFGWIKARAKLTGRLPKNSWVFSPLPDEAELYPRVSAARGEGAARTAGAGVGPRMHAVGKRCPARSAAEAALGAGMWPSAACLPACPPACPLTRPSHCRLRCLHPSASASCLPACHPRALCAACLQVAVQLPMFNERAVCQAIIDCCAELEWPAQRLKIQVGWWAGRDLQEGAWLRALGWRGHRGLLGGDLPGMQLPQCTTRASPAAALNKPVLSCLPALPA